MYCFDLFVYRTYAVVAGVGGDKVTALLLDGIKVLELNNGFWLGFV